MQDSTPREKGDTRDDVVRIAVEHGLSAYYASYLELATRSNCPLVTLDKKLYEVAVKSGVGYEDP